MTEILNSDSMTMLSQVLEEMKQEKGDSRVLSRSTERKGTRFVLSQLEEELSRQQLVNTMK
jgi:hypothetical protein